MNGLKIRILSIKTIILIIFSVMIMCILIFLSTGTLCIDDNAYKNDISATDNDLRIIQDSKLSSVPLKEPVVLVANSQIQNDARENILFFSNKVTWMEKYKNIDSYATYGELLNRSRRAYDGKDIRQAKDVIFKKVTRFQCIVTHLRGDQRALEFSRLYSNFRQARTSIAEAQDQYDFCLKLRKSCVSEKIALSSKLRLTDLKTYDRVQKALTILDPESNLSTGKYMALVKLNLYSGNLSFNKTDEIRLLSMLYGGIDIVKDIPQGISSYDYYREINTINSWFDPNIFKNSNYFISRKANIKPLAVPSKLMLGIKRVGGYIQVDLIGVKFMNISVE